MAGKDTLKGLEGGAEEEGEGDKVQPRDFFWDSIVQVIVYSILALTAVDAVFEFVRGEPGVQCLASVSDHESFINGLCYAYIPVAQYFTVFMFVQGLGIGIPHSLWVNYHAGSLRFFFHRVSSLERQSECGKYPESNDAIVNQLVTVFAKYERNTIYITYVIKLVLQLVLTVTSFILGIVYFTDFSEIFDCPSTVNDTLTNRAWPLPGEQIVCVFSTLRILYLLRVVDLILLAMILLFLTLSFIWCIKPHSMELGTDSVAAFSFQSGLDPSTHLFSPLSAALLGRRIRSDLDFMVVKLFRTDGNLGHVFNEVRIMLKIKDLDKQDRNEFDIYKREQRLGTRDILGRKLKSDIKWILKGPVISAFSQLDFKEKLFVPASIRGAVLGFGSRAPANKVAVYISFGSPSSGLANSLARLFSTILWVNFTPYGVGEPEKKQTEAQPAEKESEDIARPKPKPDGEEEEEVVKAKMFVKSTGVTTILSEEDIFLTDKDELKLLGLLVDFFMPGYNADPEGWQPETRKQANFVVVGPVFNRNHSITLDRLLIAMIKPKNRYIADGAHLLYLRPRRIGHQSVEPFFQPYTPPEASRSKFVPVRYHQVAVLRSETEEPKWPPKDSRTDQCKEKDDKKLKDQIRKDEQNESTRSEEEKKDNENTEDEKTTTPSAPLHPILSVLVGSTDVHFEFAFYTKQKIERRPQTSHPQPSATQPASASAPPTNARSGEGPSQQTEVIIEGIVEPPKGEDMEMKLISKESVL